MDFANPSWISFVTRHWLGLLGRGIRIPIMAPAVTNQDAAELLKLADEFAALHSASSRNDQVFHLPDVGHLA